MIIWILDSESGVKLLYKSFLKIKTDQDIVSGFLTAFHHFSMEEFQESLESIEMAGLKFSYILEPKYNLLLVAADTKDIKTEILLGRLQVIRKAFIEEFKDLYKKRKNSWDGNLRVFLPFIDTIENYFNQWEEVNELAQVADLYDILRVFQQILIMLRNIINNRMYSKSRNTILANIETSFNSLKKRKKYANQAEIRDISFSRENWVEIVDVNVIKCDKTMLIDYLKSILRIIVDALKESKGKALCFKYFNDEKLFAYLYNNIQILQDLNLDLFLFELFFLL
jgi:hypothetical protein